MLTPSFNSNIDHFTGHLKAGIELIEYGDYQSARCSAAAPIIWQLRQTLGAGIRFVFRNFPQPDLHSYSLEAAIAAEAAGMQGKFWLMHDLLLNNQRQFNRGNFSSFAESLNLNIEIFEEHSFSKQLIKKITSDYESGIRSGVNHAPTFFINGLRYNGSHNFKSLYNACRFAISYQNDLSFAGNLN